jgi:hypothetical protein
MYLQVDRTVYTRVSFVAGAALSPVSSTSAGSSALRGLVIAFHWLSLRYWAFRIVRGLSNGATRTIPNKRVAYLPTSSFMRILIRSVRGLLPSSPSTSMWSRRRDSPLAGFSLLFLYLRVKSKAVRYSVYRTCRLRFNGLVSINFRSAS